MLNGFLDNQTGEMIDGDSPGYPRTAKKRKRRRKKKKTKSVDPPPVLTAAWRISEGTLCCGSLRIATFDFDTNSSEDVKQAIFKQMLDGLNKQLAKPKEN